MFIVFKFYKTKLLRRNRLTLFSSQQVETLPSDFISISISTLYCTIPCTVLKITEKQNSN